jgi:hypothetical protein
MRTRRRGRRAHGPGGSPPPASAILPELIRSGRNAPAIAAGTLLKRTPPTEENER